MHEALAAKLAHGGAVVISSAAAVTIGRFSLPVYEIYKAGQEPRWLDGLDLLGPFGFSEGCVVVPHFDNAEGGTHDTRFCYMGERRLAVLEAMLPEAAWVLGVDEHTGLVIDLAAGEARVDGRGTVTVRWRGHSRQFPDGACVPLAELARAARDMASRPVAAPAAAPGAGPAGDPLTPPPRTPRARPVPMLEHRNARGFWPMRPRSSGPLPIPLPAAAPVTPSRPSCASTGPSSSGRRTRCNPTSRTAPGPFCTR